MTSEPESRHPGLWKGLEVFTPNQDIVRSQPSPRNSRLNHSDLECWLTQKQTPGDGVKKNLDVFNPALNLCIRGPVVLLTSTPSNPTPASETEFFPRRRNPRKLSAPTPSGGSSSHCEVLRGHLMFPGSSKRDLSGGQTSLPSCHSGPWVCPAL